MTQNHSNAEIINSRVFAHSPQKVFAAFSDGETLAKWWGPSGFSNTFHSFDFRSGGSWTFTMHGPDGKDFKNQSVFGEISPPKIITIDHTSGPKYILEIKLEEQADGTLLSWTQRFETAEMRDRIAEFAGNANEENLDRLASLLASKSAGR